MPSNKPYGRDFDEKKSGVYKPLNEDGVGDGGKRRR